jgi:glutamate synthase domain-containing protein 2
VIADAFAEAHTRDPDTDKRWVVVVDGERNQLRTIQQQAEAIGVEPTIIVDFVHALEDLWKAAHPQPYKRDAYQGTYQDVPGTPEEPHTKFIHQLATDGLSKVGHHGPVEAMGVPAPELPRWDDIQFVTGQLGKVPELDEAPCGTELIVGPGARKPLRLEIPVIVSDMSFGALSEEAKVALARGAELSGVKYAGVVPL